MTSKFEQLIEFVINDEEAKAKELFHDIVVEKSREIYENLMNEDMGGAADEDLVDDVETDQEGMNEEEGDAEEEATDDADAEFDDAAEEAGEEETDDIEAAGDEAGEGDIEDRVVDLEDKLDELMAEFEALMGDEGVEGEEVDGEFDMEPVDGDVGGDAYAQDDTAEFTDVDVPMTENVSLQATPKPVTSEPAGTNTRSTTAFNSGAAGMASKPVQTSGTESNPDGTTAYKAPNNYATKGEGSVKGANSFKNSPGQDGSKLSAAPKPTNSQAGGVNARTPFPKG